MSVGQAMILRSQPQAIARRVNELIAREVTKGCTGDISPVPVRLEPAFSSLLAAPPNSCTTPDIPCLQVSTDDLADPVRFRLWISPQQKFDWNHSELWLKQLAMASDRVVFQIVGNVDVIEVVVLCAQRDEVLIKAAFEAQFNMCEITSASTTRLECVPPEAWGQAQFRDFYPPPPYSHMLTCFNEFRTTPFEALLTTMRLLPKTAIAFYQCAFQPVHPSHDWHRNVSMLFDLEYASNLHNSPASSFRTPQQAPTHGLTQMAKDVEIRAHNDKPFFSAAVRIGVVGSPVPDERILGALASTLRVFQHGGRPLEFLCQSDYHRCVSITDVRRMLVYGFTHRAGFLVNSLELTGLVHLFPASILEPRDIPVEILPTLPLRGEKLAVGTRIGICRYAGKDIYVCVPSPIRALSTHIASSSGTGKTTLMQSMCLQDIDDGTGVVFIDSHGDGVRDLMAHIKPSDRPRTIYFNPGDPEWIPLWNPMRLPPGGDPYRLADDMVSIFKRVSQDWGDRLEHVTRYSCIGLQHLPNPCIMDIYSLLRQKSQESDQLRERILAVSQDEPVKKFFQTDYLKDYTKSDLQAPKHKLSKLIAAGSVSLMLSQSESLIDFRQIMDEGMILLVDLSDLGAEVREILGSFILTSFFMAGLGRNKTKSENRRRLSMFVDEAHLYVSSDAIENLVAQARKFGINLCLAHQYLKQFHTAKIDALSTVGCTIIGRLDRNDSHFFANALQGKVEPEEIMALEPYEMIARIGSEIVRLKTVDLPKLPDGCDGKEIVEESRRRYCRPAGEVRQWIRNRSATRQEPFAAADPGFATHSFSEEALRYEEF